MKIILGFFQTTRFIKSIVVAIFLTLALTDIHYGIGVLIFLMFSFSFNDWVDAHKDAIGHPNRAIPSGKLTSRQAFGMSSGLFIVGLGWTVFYLSEYAVGFYAVYFFSVLYSYVLKPDIPVLATPVWSLTIAILFIQPFSFNLVFYLATALIVYSYELLLDYRDRESDKKFCKTRTLASILGKNTFVVSGVCLTIGILLLIM